MTEANFQGKLADLRAGELRGAFGISNRINYSLFEPDPLYIATEKAEGETEVSEIYGEILYPVFGSFELEIGARYSDFETGDWSFDAKSYKALVQLGRHRMRGASAAAGSARTACLTSPSSTRARRARCSAGARPTMRAWSTRCIRGATSPRIRTARRLRSSAGNSSIVRAAFRVQNDFDIQGANNYPNDGRALPHSYRLITGGNPRLEPEDGRHVRRWVSCGRPRARISTSRWIGMRSRSTTSSAAWVSCPPTSSASTRTAAATRRSRSTTSTANGSRASPSTRNRCSSMAATST